jgi:serine/threonine protein kinase
MLLGLPILPATTETHLVDLIIRRFGPIPPKMYLGSPKENLWDESGTIKTPDVLCEESANNEDWNTKFVSYFVSESFEDIMANFACDIEGDNRMENRLYLLNLIGRMLQIDPDLRISPEEAIEHPFMHLVFGEHQNS